jgi:hypothetical protein
MYSHFNLEAPPASRQWMSNTNSGGDPLPPVILKKHMILRSALCTSGDCCLLARIGKKIWYFALVRARVRCVNFCFFLFVKMLYGNYVLFSPVNIWCCENRNSLSIYLVCVKLNCLVYFFFYFPNYGLLFLTEEHKKKHNYPSMVREHFVASTIIWFECIRHSLEFSVQRYVTT